MEGTAATPSSAPTTTGPASFSDLPSTAWSDASSASTPTSDVAPTDNAGAATTAPPVETQAPEGQPQQAGEPPKERWADILSNARTKAAEEALAPYAWAKQIPQQEFQQIQNLARTLSADPVAGLQQLIAEIRKDPQHDAAIRSLAARALSQGRQPQAPQAPDLNPIPVQLDNGQTIGLYSADQIAALKQQWQTELRQELEPVTQTVKSLQQEKAAAARQQQIDHFVTDTYQDMATWPGMDVEANRTLIAQELARAEVDPNNPIEVKLAAERAWRLHVAPLSSRQAEAKLLDSLKTKAMASTGVNPGSAAPSASRAVTKFADLPADAWR